MARIYESMWNSMSQYTLDDEHYQAQVIYWFESKNSEIKTLIKFFPERGCLVMYLVFLYKLNFISFQSSFFFPF